MSNKLAFALRSTKRYLFRSKRLASIKLVSFQHLCSVKSHKNRDFSVIIAVDNVKWTFLSIQLAFVL